MSTTQNWREEVDSLQKKLCALINQVDELYTKRINAGCKVARDSQVKDLESKIKVLFKELINTYKDIAEKTRDKKTWLELAKLFSPWLNEHYYYLDPEEKEREENKKQFTKYIIRALEEHLKEFPDLLKAIGLIEPDELIFEVFRKDKTTRDLARVRYILLAPVTIAIRYIQCWFLRLYLATSPDEAKAWIKLAQHYAELGELKDAENACERALSLSPDDELSIALSLIHI